MHRLMMKVRRWLSFETYTLTYKSISAPEESNEEGSSHSSLSEMFRNYSLSILILSLTSLLFAALSSHLKLKGTGTVGGRALYKEVDVLARLEQKIYISQ